MNEYVFLRYTGTFTGSHNYPGAGVKKMAFGNNPSHFQQVVTRQQADALKRLYTKELLEIPNDMSRVPMALDTLIVSSSLLRDETKKKLVGAYQTLGEVIADQAAIYAMFDEYDAPEILNAIRGHFGLPLLPQPVRPVAEEPVREGLSVARNVHPDYTVYAEPVVVAAAPVAEPAVEPAVPVAKPTVKRRKTES